MSLRRTLSATLLLLPLAVATLPARAETFLGSDDYEEGEGGAVNAFLHDDDYRLMTEDIERNDVEFDWGWIRPEGWTEPVEPQGSKLSRLLHPGSRPKYGKNPGFDLQALHTVYIPPIVNKAGLMKPELLEEIRADFAQAASALGLEVVDTRDKANVTLELAVVDQMRTGVNAVVYNIHVDPFVTIELRFVDTHSGDKYLLVRNRKHGGDVADAAMNFADDLVKFLR